MNDKGEIELISVCTYRNGRTILEAFPRLSRTKVSHIAACVILCCLCVSVEAETNPSDTAAAKVELCRGNYHSPGGLKGTGVGCSVWLILP